MADVKQVNVILDTNWFISASINRSARRLLYNTFFTSSVLTVYYSTELLAEYERVIQRKKFRKLIRPDQIRRFLKFVLPRLVKTDAFPFMGVRDVNDNYLIGMSEACRADFLITGDEDLLTMGRFRQTAILRMSEFLQMLPSLLSGIHPPDPTQSPPR